MGASASVTFRVMPGHDVSYTLPSPCSSQINPQAGSVGGFSTYICATLARFDIFIDPLTTSIRRPRNLLHLPDLVGLSYSQ